MRWIAILAIVVTTPLPATAQQPSPVTRPAQIQVTPLMRLTYAEQCVRPGGLIVFQGSGLPAVAGNRKLAVQTNAGLVELGVTTWSSTKIEAKIPADKRLAPGGSYPVGIQDAAGAWVVRSARALVVCAAPLVAPPSVVLQPGVLAQPPRAVLPPPAVNPGQQPQPAPAPKPAEPAPPAPEPAEPAPPAPEPAEEPAGVPVAEAPAPEPAAPARGADGSYITPAIQLTGYGAASPPRAVFPGRTLSTPAIRLTGFGAGPPPRAAFEPMTIATPAIRLTGVRP